MIRASLRSAALAALACFAAPLSAQVEAPPAAEIEESLRCAIWASYFSVAFEDEEVSVAFAHALNYFVGRYEGLTGQGIDGVVDEALIVETADHVDQLTPLCSSRMEAYGARLAAWGEAVAAIGDRLPADEPLVPPS